MKVVNVGKDKRLVKYVKKQVREALKNYIGKSIGLENESVDRLIISFKEEEM